MSDSVWKVKDRGINGKVTFIYSTYMAVFFQLEKAG